MKVKVIKDYYDTKLCRGVEAGEDLEVSEIRGAVLINAMVAERVEEKAPKRKRAK